VTQYEMMNRHQHRRLYKETLSLYILTTISASAPAETRTRHYG